MSQVSEKRLVAAAAVRCVQDGMRVGLGSGSTSALAVQLLGERIQNEGLQIIGAPTSRATQEAAIQAGVPLMCETEDFELDLALDGADEATRQGWLIKGGGGALLRERIVAAAAKTFIVMVDGSKVVDRLGSFPLPVEVVRFGWRHAQRELLALGAEAHLRQSKKGEAFVTDEGNYILDCRFPTEMYLNPQQLGDTIDRVAGVADHGLFVGMTDRLLIARGEQVEEVPLKRLK